MRSGEWLFSVAAWKDMLLKRVVDDKVNYEATADKIETPRSDLN